MLSTLVGSGFAGAGGPHILGLVIRLVKPSEDAATSVLRVVAASSTAPEVDIANNSRHCDVRVPSWLRGAVLKVVLASTIVDVRAKPARGVCETAPGILVDAIGDVVAAIHPGTGRWMAVGPGNGLNCPARHIMVNMIIIVRPMATATQLQCSNVRCRNFCPSGESARDELVHRSLVVRLFVRPLSPLTRILSTRGVSSSCVHTPRA